VPDWATIPIQDFDAVAQEDEGLGLLVGQLILERLPFKFDTKHQYLAWKSKLAQGLQVDARDIVVVGSAATGRSLNPRTQFGVFDPKRSDLDIAVTSPLHFDHAWHWFRTANPNLLNLDSTSFELFEKHKRDYIFRGFIAAEVFLGYFPMFGAQWIEELQRSEEYLPDILRGRKTSIRLYRDGASLRKVQEERLRLYRRSKGITDPL
jgi:hypothetical protein